MATQTSSHSLCADLEVLKNYGLITRYEVDHDIVAQQYRVRIARAEFSLDCLFDYIVLHQHQGSWEEVVKEKVGKLLNLLLEAYYNGTTNS